MQRATVTWLRFHPMGRWGCDGHSMRRGASRRASTNGVMSDGEMRRNARGRAWLLTNDLLTATPNTARIKHSVREYGSCNPAGAFAVLRCSEQTRPNLDNLVIR